MELSELSRDQIIQLKQSLLMQQNEDSGEMTSYEELFKADSIITDEMIYEEYSSIEFSEDDFFC